MLTDHIIAAEIPTGTLDPVVSNGLPKFRAGVFAIHPVGPEAHHHRCSGAGEAARGFGQILNG